jgi:hypothetical protein
VKGSIYNPNDKGVKNVVIRYYIWKKFMGKDGYGLIIKVTGGLETARIKYLPPKQTVDFTTGEVVPEIELTSGSRTKVLASVQRYVKPDPIEAEISAEWER